jgi:hypothetical protein
VFRVRGLGYAHYVLRRPSRVTGYSRSIFWLWLAAAVLAVVVAGGLIARAT